MSAYHEAKEANAKIDALIEALGFNIQKQVIKKSGPSTECPGATDFWIETEYKLIKRND